MKKSIIIAAALAAALTSCQKEQLREADSHGFTVRALREACIGTKATVSDDGAFSWSAKDVFSLYANGKYYDFTTTDGGASASFNGYYCGDQGGYAVFPNNLNPKIGDAVSVTLPETYEWKDGAINTPMLATFDSGEDMPESITFNHLGGLIRVTLRNIPATATKFVFSTTNNMPITGTFTAEEESEDDGSKLQISSTSDSNSSATSVAFTFEASSSVTKRSFYVPLPVGEYAVKIALYNASNAELWAISGSKTHTVTRAKYIQTTAITIASTGADGESSAMNQEVPANFSGTYYLPNTTADVYLTMNSTDNEVTIAYANETSAKQPANVYINCGGSSIKTLNVDLSESHVEISGNEGSNATIGTVTAKSSNTTLVLDKTVTIGEKLTVAAGSVEIAGKVNDVEVANTVDADVTVKVTKDATVSGKLSVAKAASVEVAAKVSTVEVTAAVPQVTIAAEVATVMVNKAAEGTTTESAPVIWVTESGKVTEAVKDATATTSGTANVTVVAAKGQVEGTETSVEDGQVAKVVTVTDGTTETTASSAVKTTEDYLVAGGEVTLGEDLKGYFTISEDVTINLNGKTISNSESDKATFTVAEGASLTINGEGNITNTATGKPAIENSGTLTINGGTYSGVASAIELRAGALTINDGSFTATASDFSDNGSEGFNTISGAAIAVSQYAAEKAVKLAVTGGTFSGQKAIYENDSRTTVSTNVDIYIDSRLSNIGEVSIKHKIPYLTFSAGAKQRFKMTFKGSMVGTLKGKLEYSLGGGDWTTVTSGNSNVYFGGELGDLRLRGKSEIGTANGTSNYALISMNYSKAPVTASGDIRVLIDWESYATVSTSNARFAYLFSSGCTTMTSAPKLPATELADYCYYSMFKGCTSLTAAPELPATTLKDRCYYEMFKNCSSLSSVTIKATSAENHDWGGVYVALHDWLSGTASEGTVYAPAATISSDGKANALSEYLPTGWSVQTSN